MVHDQNLGGLWKAHNCSLKYKCQKALDSILRLPHPHFATYCIFEHLLLMEAEGP